MFAQALLFVLAAYGQVPAAGPSQVLYDVVLSKDRVVLSHPRIRTLDRASAEIRITGSAPKNGAPELYSIKLTPRVNADGTVTTSLEESIAPSADPKTSNPVVTMVYRQKSGENIVFFRDPATGKVEILKPSSKVRPKSGVIVTKVTMSVVPDAP